MILFSIKSRKKDQTQYSHNFIDIRTSIVLKNSVDVSLENRPNKKWN